MSRLLVTGATGFLGRALCSSLQGKHHEVVAFSSGDGDIATGGTLDTVGPMDHVFHLAGRTFVPDSWNDPVDFNRVNVLGTLNVLQFCRSVGARLTFVSAYLYGVPDRLPISENCVPKPNNPYALSKHMAEQACAFYAAHHGVHVTVIRPFNIYGPGQSSQFLIPHIVDQVRKGSIIRVKDLAPRRDYVYIDDVVDAMVKSLGTSHRHGVFNIGAGYSLSVAEIIDVIQSVAGTHLPVESNDEVRKNEISDLYADISKADTALGWYPTVSFRDGVSRLLKP